MTTRVLNEIPRENAADYRRVLNRKELPALKRKKSEPRKNMCSQFKKYDPRWDCYTVQLARYIKQPPRLVAPAGMDPLLFVQLSRKNGREYAELRDGTSETFELYFPKGMPRLSAVEFVRLSPNSGGPKEMDGDNLDPAFKPIRDGLARYARHGDQWRKHKATLGQADGYLDQQGVRWIYRQSKCTGNTRLMGIQIILHCAPRTT